MEPPTKDPARNQVNSELSDLVASQDHADTLRSVDLLGMARWKPAHHSSALAVLSYKKGRQRKGNG